MKPSSQESCYKSSFPGAQKGPDARRGAIRGARRTLRVRRSTAGAPQRSRWAFFSGPLRLVHCHRLDYGPPGPEPLDTQRADVDGRPPGEDQFRHQLPDDRAVLEAVTAMAARHVEAFQVGHPAEDRVVVGRDLVQPRPPPMDLASASSGSRTTACSTLSRDDPSPRSC